MRIKSAFSRKSNSEELSSLSSSSSSFFMMDIRILLGLLSFVAAASADGAESSGPLSSRVVVVHQNMQPVPIECFQPPDSGNDVKDMARIYYDHETRTCKPFSYTGSGGNANRFLSIKNCYRICHPFKYQAKPPIGRHPVGLPAPVGGPDLPHKKIMYPVETVQNVPVVRNVKVVRKGYVEVQT